jgi:O-antigen/teichoic acid export membrane protein
MAGNYRLISPIFTIFGHTGATMTDAHDHIGFTQRVRSALIWRSGSQILAQIITWASTFIVINLLDPADYGLFALTQVVLAFLSFLNGYGFANALVQSETVEPRRLRQAFGLLLLLNGSLAAIQLAGAPLAAAYYGQPIVADLLRVQALIYLATPFITLPEVMLARRLEFRRQALVNLVAALVGALTALVGALSGWGVWTLVYAPIAMFWTRAIGLTLIARVLVWPTFDFRGCGNLLAFGTAVLASQFLWLIQTQADVLIGGRLFDLRELGLYTTALFLTQLIATKFVPPLNDVAFPAYARIQHDPGAVRWNFLKALRLILLVTAPLYLGLAVSAEPLVAALLHTKWQAMVPFVQLLAFAMPFTTIQILFAPVTNAMGQPRIAVQCALAGAIIFPAAFLVGAQWGIIGLAWAWLAAAPCLMLVTARLSRRATGVSLTDIARAALPGIGCALAMAGLVTALDGMTPVGAWTAPIRLAALVSFGGLSYAALLTVLERETLGELWRLIKRQPAI